MAQPTEEELLIINSIIYTEDFVNRAFKPNTNIYEWAYDFNFNTIESGKLPAEINREEFTNIINTIKNNKSTYSNMIIKDVDNSQSANTDGTQKVVNVTIEYEGALIIAYKGTGGPIEWRDNGVGGYSNITDTQQQINALNYYKKMMNKYGESVNDVYVTGHSKGGNKAQYIGVTMGAQEKLKHVYSFDGQGFGQAFLLKYKEAIEENKDKITNTSNEYDFVNIILFSIAGERKYIKNATSFGTELDIAAILKHKLGGFHSPYSMFKTQTIGGKTTLTLNEVSEQSAVMKELQGLFAHYAKFMNEEDWRYLCFSIMGAMMDGEKSLYGGDYSTMPDGFVERLVALSKGYTQNNKGIDFMDIFKFLYPLFGFFQSIGVAGLYAITDGEEYSIVTRDFSDDVKHKLLSIVESVDEEPWFDITRWDVFYRIENLLGDIDFSENSKELAEYHRKMIDIDGISKKNILEIFNSIYEKDRSFAKELQEINTKLVDINKKLTTVANGFSI